MPLSGLSADFRFAVHLLRKNPGATLAAVCALAAGIGFNTTMFSSADVLLYRPLLVDGIERTAFIYGQNAGEPLSRLSVSGFHYDTLRRSLRSVSSLSAARMWEANLTGSGDPEHVAVWQITPDFFQTLNVQPVIGRPLLPEEAVTGKDRTALISWALWDRRFGRDPSVLGKEFQLDGRTFQIAGVMPQYFSFPPPIDVWTPLALTPAQLADASTTGLHLFTRLNDGATLGQLNSELDVLARRLALDRPDSFRNRATRAFSIPNEISGSLTHDYTLMLIGCCVFLLLIACVNVANLQLARALGRTREIAIRGALGAGRWRILRQVLVETSLLSFLGMMGGLLLAVWLVDVNRSSMPAEVMRYIPGWQRLSINGWVLFWTAVATSLSAIVSGLIPAFWLSGHTAASRLRESGRGSTQAASRRAFSSILVTAQVAISVVLIVGAVLMAKGFGNLERFPDGVRPERLLTFHVSLPDSRFSSPDLQRAFASRLVSGLNTIPGAQSASLVANLPYSQNSWRAKIAIQDYTPQPGEQPSVLRQPVDPAYFSTFGMRIIRGRGLSSSDHKDSQLVAVVDEAFTARYFPGLDPLGRKITMEGQAYTIVGIVENVVHNFIERLPSPSAYFAVDQHPVQSFDVVIRTAADPDSLIPAARAELKAVDPSIPLFLPRSFRKLVRDSVTGIAYVAGTLTVLGVVALLLAAIGVYSLLAFAVGERTREFGVRLAVGATPREIFTLVFRRGFGLALIGLSAGLLAGFAFARLLSGLFFGVSPSDPIAFGAVPAVLLSCVTLACWLPASRAMRTDPVNALHHE